MLLGAGTVSEEEEGRSSLLELVEVVGSRGEVEDHEVGLFEVAEDDLGEEGHRVTGDGHLPLFEHFLSLPIRHHRRPIPLGMPQQRFSLPFLPRMEEHQPGTDHSPHPFQHFPIALLSPNRLKIPLLLNRGEDLRLPVKELVVVAQLGPVVADVDELDVEERLEDGELRGRGGEAEEEVGVVQGEDRQDLVGCERVRDGLQARGGEVVLGQEVVLGVVGVVDDHQPRVELLPESGIVALGHPPPPANGLVLPEGLRLLFRTLWPHPHQHQLPHNQFHFSDQVHRPLHHD